MENLSDKLRTLQFLTDQKKAVDKTSKELSAQIEEQKSAILQEIIDQAETMGISAADFSVTVDGRKYGLTVKPYYSIRADDRERAFPMLRMLGLGDLIVERVDDRQLTRRLQEIAEENGGALPEDYDALPVSQFEKTDIYNRTA